MKVLIEEKNIKQVISDFDAIEAAIESAGVDVPKGTDTKDYAGKIGEVSELCRSLGRGEGYQEGYAEGETAGYENGYNKGYADGEADASLAGEAITITDKGDIATLPDTAEVGEVYSLPTEQDQHYMWNGQEWIAVGDTRDINPEWTDWRYFGFCDSRNSLVAKLKYSDTSKGTTFNNMFRSCTKLTTFPEFDTSRGTDFSYMFQYCQQTKTIPQYNTSNGTNFSYMFQYCGALTSIPELDTSNGTNFQLMFNNCPKLQSIPKLNVSKVTSSSYLSGMFQTCIALTDLTIEGSITQNNFNVQQSPLSHESLMSIINALADKTGVSGTFKVTLGATNLAKLTTEELEIAYNKGWEVA